MVRKTETQYCQFRAQLFSTNRKRYVNKKTGSLLPFWKIQKLSISNKLSVANIKLRYSSKFR
jgi:hypothetical protein